jgi:predicted nucleic acid-binding protein
VIFVDTSFWIATQSGRDAHHQQARALLTQIGATSLVTTNHVRGETWTWLRRKGGHAAAVRYLDLLLRSPQTEVVNVTPEIEDRALTWLRTHDEREYSFVDATSFALMRSRKIRQALAFDGDFAAAGFVELRTVDG